jgi:toxin ParE1/3/4
VKVRFNRGALTDLAEILDYVAERNPRAASDLSARFEEAARLLGTLPDLGTETGRSGFRRLVVGNYLMIYEVKSSQVLIHYVRHGARLRPWEADS